MVCFGFPSLKTPEHLLLPFDKSCSQFINGLLSVILKFLKLDFDSLQLVINELQFLQGLLELGFDLVAIVIVIPCFGLSIRQVMLKLDPEMFPNFFCNGLIVNTSLSGLARLVGIESCLLCCELESLVCSNANLLLAQDSTCVAAWHRLL